MQIGSISLARTAALAPMAGVGDRAFREICKELGAAYVVGEMVSSKGMCYENEKSLELLSVGEAQRPMAVQIFGSEPDTMAAAARMALACRPDVIDINMGCPAPKIAGNGGGSALMRDLPLAERIIRAVVAAVDLPVTVKMRTGWDAAHQNAVELAKIAEACGAAAVTIHGRTREQMYRPSVDLEMIRRVKEAVRIPVIGNGDITGAASAKAMYDATGVDLVMIGRGALGSPWVFREVREFFTAGHLPPPLPPEEKARIILRHGQLAIRYKGETVAMREMRKHAGYYMKGFPGAARLRQQAGQLTVFADLERLVEGMLAAQSAVPQP